MWCLTPIFLRDFVGVDATLAEVVQQVFAVRFVLLANVFHQLLARTQLRLELECLVEEVLGRQPPAVGEFLLRTSILDRLC